MIEETFESFMAKERERLSKKREDVVNRQRKLGEELEAVEKELMAIDAYEAVKQGKKPATRRSSGTRAPRGAVRGKVLEVVKSKPDGATKGEVVAMMGLQGNEKGGRQISNALSALLRGDRLTKNEDKYLAV